MLNLVTKTKLLGLIVDQKLTWVANVLETNKSFLKKWTFSNILVFLPRRILKELNDQVIPLAVKHGFILWGLCVAILIFLSQ